jgi:hypothetical protein
MITFPASVNVMLALPHRSTSCAFALTIIRSPSASTRGVQRFAGTRAEHPHDDWQRCVAIFEGHDDRPTDVRGVKIDNGARPYRRCAGLARVEQQRGSAVVGDGDQFADDHVRRRILVQTCRMLVQQRHQGIGLCRCRVV